MAIYTSNILASSANINIELDTIEGKSLINIIKSKGPKTDPLITEINIH